MSVTIGLAIFPSVRPRPSLSRRCSAALRNKRRSPIDTASRVVSLAVERRRVVHAEEETKQLFVADQSWIEANFDRLGVAGCAFMHGFVIGVGGGSPGVADFRCHHAREFSDDLLHAPETAAGQGGHFQLRGGRLRRRACFARAVRGKQRLELAVTFRRQALDGNEAQRGRVDAVPLFGRPGVGAGPSENRWPRWESPARDRTSVRSIPSDASLRVAIWPASIGRVKLGQPVPESNLSSELKSGSPVTTST